MSLCPAQFEPVQDRRKTHTCQRAEGHAETTHLCPICGATWTPSGVIDPHADPQARRSGEESDHA